MTIYQKETFTITTDKSQLDMDTIHGFLSEQSYWAKGISKALLQKGLDHSLCFGLFDGDQQIGFTRVVTDFTRFAYLADVFVLPSYRGQQIGSWLIESVLDYLEQHQIRRVCLTTNDAQAFYRQHGFTEFPCPERWMEKMRQPSVPK